MKRNVILEIVQRKQRLHRLTDRMRLALFRLIPILHARNFLLEPKDTAGEKIERDELLRYVPIAIVACLEGYYRLVYRDLIDAGAPYSNNARRTLKDLKFGVDLVLDIRAKKVTAGELLAVHLPHNRLTDIDENLFNLTGRKFLIELKGRGLLETALDDEAWNHVYPEVERLLAHAFFLRHVFCHELATKVKPKAAELSDCCDAAVGLIFATEEYLADLIPKPKR